MEIKMNKEILEYKETIFFGLTMRQFIFSLLACIVTVTLYFILKPYLRNRNIIVGMYSKCNTFCCIRVLKI